MFRDVRHILHSLLRARWFTAGALLTFAVGLGLNIAVFAVVDRVLFRALPFRDVGRLVTIHPIDPKTGRVYFSLSKDIAVAARRTVTAVEDLAFAGNARAYALEGTDTVPLRLTESSFNLLDVLGVRTILGRGFTLEDARLQLRLVLLREEVWRSRFGSDPRIFHRSFGDASGPAQVVGVLPAGFVNPSVNWVTPSDGLILNSSDLTFATPGEAIPAPIARLAPNATAALAQQQFAALLTATQGDRAEAKRTGVRVEPIQQGVFWNVRGRSAILFAGGVLVWLIACTNLGMLMAARAKSREQQAIIRFFLGATRLRIVSLTVTEVALVCAAGAIVALMALAWTLPGLARVVPTSVGSLTLVSVDCRVVGFVLLGAILGSGLAGLYPLLVVARIERQRTLRLGPVTPQNDRRQGSGLLIAESALGTVLVLAGTFAMRSFVGLVQTDLGFSASGLYSVDVRTPTGGSAETRLAWYREAINAIAAHPGTVAASAVDVAVGSGEAAMMLADEEGRQVLGRQVFSAYFDVMQTPVLAGRTFTDRETRAMAPVAVLSAGAAQLFWPDAPFEKVIGQQLRLRGEIGRQVLGIVADTRERHAKAAAPEVLVPAGTGLTSTPTFLVRTENSTGPDRGALRSILRRHFGSDAVVTVSSVSTRMEPWLRDPRFYAYLFGAFGAVALLLSGIGLFALTSFEASLRQREIAVRLALGATPEGILRMFIVEAVRPVTVGVVLGVVAAFWSARSFQLLLHQVDARDLKMYGCVAFLFLVVAAAAAWRPARRAGRSDPLSVLRAE